jgi:hypothetical protein
MSFDTAKIQLFTHTNNIFGQKRGKREVSLTYIKDYLSIKFGFLLT